MKSKTLELRGNQRTLLAAKINTMRQYAETAGYTVFQFAEALAAELDVAEYILIAEVEARKEALERAKAALFIIALEREVNVGDANALFDAARTLRNVQAELKEAESKHNMWMETHVKKITE